MKQRTPLRRRTPLRQGKPSEGRGEPLERQQARPERTPRSFRDPQDECRAPNCETYRRRGAHHHHVVYEQHAERYGDPHDPRNALRLCFDCHGAHHGTQPLPLSALRDENFEYAAEVMGGRAAFEYLRRFYTGDDPRLEALLPEGETHGTRRRCSS